MDIFNTYNNFDKKIIEEYIKYNQEENLSLEFKQISSANFNLRDDRKNFAKALSGFANSSGGLIVWGVEASKNPQGIDCAHATREIESLSLFLSKLNQYTGEFVSPIVEEVKHKKINTKGDKGFAITLIPQSDIGPHMAKAGEDRYYKRSGDSFYKMEHFDIEDMFGRRKKPKLFFSTQIIKRGVSGGPQGKSFGCEIVLGIQNTGRGTAKYPYISLKVSLPYNIDLRYGLDGNRHHGLPILPIGGQRSSSGIVQFGANSDTVIHPQAVLEVTKICFDIPENSTKIADINIESEIVAEDIRNVKEKTIIKGSEIIEKILPKEINVKS